jgi:hypothetical protein
MGPRADVEPKYRPLVRVDKEDASKHATGQLGAAGVRKPDETGGYLYMCTDCA